MHRIPGRILLITAAFALFLVPIAAIAAGGFEDVGDDNIFRADIQWMKDADVTRGCNPPANTKYCPGDNVTREQMSAFMHRLAVNKVVDAATAVEAENADTLDGKDSTDFAASTHNHDGTYQPVAVVEFDAITTPMTGITDPGVANVAVVTINTSVTAHDCVGGPPPVRPRADILVTATGYASHLSDEGGESALFEISRNGVVEEGTRRRVGGGASSFAMQWLFNPQSSGTTGDVAHTFSLAAFPQPAAAGNHFDLDQAQITAELIRDTYCP